MSDRPYDPFKDGFTVEPGQDGSLIVCSNAPRGYDCPRWGFSNAADLMRWLQKYEKPQQQQQQQQQQSQPETTKERLLRERAEREKAANGLATIALPAPVSTQVATPKRRRMGIF